MALEVMVDSMGLGTLHRFLTRAPREYSTAIPLTEIALPRSDEMPVTAEGNDRVNLIVYSYFPEFKRVGA